jgi:diguanylate cyclase (GGDEF)-like protein/PAS domain S-box-containing protein
MATKHSHPAKRTSATAKQGQHWQTEEAEEALWESEERFNGVFDDAPIGIGLEDVEGVVLQVNQAVCDMTGYTEAEIVGRKYTEFTHPDDIEIGAKHNRRLFSGEISQYRLEKRYRHKKGHYIWVDMSVSLVRDARGKPSYLIEYVQDITERKQMDEMLRENRHLLSAIIDGAPDFIFARDLEGRHTMVNNARAQAVGKSVQEILGKTNSDVFSPDIAKAFDQEDQEVLMSGETRSYETLMEIDGKTRTSLTTKYMYFDSEGNPAGVLGISHDITDRKMAEEEIKHLANHDELTGLPTLRLGKDRLSSAIALARRSKTSAAVLYLDLDGFKEVNDTLGHKAGDQVLIEVGMRMTQIIRETDTVARIGGDEFVIVLGQIEEEIAPAKIAKKIIKTLTRPIRLDEQEVNISASIGISLYPKHGETPDELISKADKAMYAIKHKGKNNYAMVDGDI